MTFKYVDPLGVARYNLVRSFIGWAEHIIHITRADSNGPP
jgi:hypothetical protein